MNNISKFGGKYNIKAKVYKGKGEFLGAETTEQTKEVFKKVIEESEGLS